MSTRLQFADLSKTVVQKLTEMTATGRKASIEQSLVDLVNLRASQINGCTFCVDMHVKEAVIHKETPLRLHHVVVWRESQLFSPRERMALEWTEAVTQLATNGVPDALYEKARSVFSDKELVDLTAVVAIINVWNRLSVSFRSEPGSLDAALGIAGSGLS